MADSSAIALPQIGRRRFLQGLGAVGAGIALGSIPDSILRAQTGGARSLVCVFLAGGADSFNMVVPLDRSVAGQTHDAYAATRGDFAVPASQLLGIGDGDFGLHPLLPGLAQLDAQNRLATVMNVGPIERPTTRADFRSERFVPQSLFAHDAQQKLWQTGRTQLVSDRGWGGAIEQRLDAPGVAPAFSLAGTNVFQTGADARYTRLSPTVAIERLLGHDATLRASRPFTSPLAGVLERSVDLAAASSNPFDRVMADTVRGSITATEQLQAATASSQANDVGMDDVGGNGLGTQLRVVARLIKNREELSMPRQVFFVRMGGWDTHRAQDEILPVLLRELDAALTSFHTALDDLGVADSVTTFTASDFGRTLTANGDGTDHGWGGHAMVMGGAVNGGRFGTVPSYATNNNPDDVGDRDGNFAGRLIPTTSVSQYGATLSRWMGLDATALAEAFPDVANFETSNLGFL